VSDVAALLADLRGRNVRLWIDDERLKINAPVGALNAAMREALVCRKDEIIASLRQAADIRRLPDSMVPFNLGGSRPTLFFLAGDHANTFCVAPLARLLGSEQPVVVVLPTVPDTDPQSRVMATLARHYVEQIRHYQPEGPYQIAGLCMGGAIAFEAARQLVASGQQVALLAIIGGRFPSGRSPSPSWTCWLLGHVSALTSGPPAERWQYFVTKLKQIARRLGGAPRPDVPDPLSANQRMFDNAFDAVRGYRPPFYPGEVDLFFQSCDWLDFRGWRTVAATIRERRFPFNVHELRAGPHVSLLAEALSSRLRRPSACDGRTQMQNK
jgi:hypothetical protein